MDHGKVALDSTPTLAVSKYLAPVVEGRLDYSNATTYTRPSLVAASVTTSAGNGVHQYGAPLLFTFRINCPTGIRKGAFSFQVMNDLDTPVVHILLLDSEQDLFRVPGVFELTCDIPFSRLYIGTYSLTTHISGPPGGAHFETISNICAFEVVSSKVRDHFWRPRTCTYVEDANWTIRCDIS